MSYNITSMKVKAVRLVLPLTFDFQQWLQSQPSHDERGYENVGKRWCVQDGSAIHADLAVWKLSVSNQELMGIIAANGLIATGIEWRGECSGILYNDVLLPLFREFNGNLSAIVTWEGGDSVQRLTITNGVVSERNIDEEEPMQLREASIIEGSLEIVE